MGGEVELGGRFSLLLRDGEYLFTSCRICLSFGIAGTGL